MFKFRLSYTWFLIFLPSALLAQIKIFPHEQHNNQTQKLERSARIKSDPLELPFWDDFSSATDTSNYTVDHPVDLLWVDNQKVHVTTGQAINPPSINVATFDGINEFGVPYSPSPTDFLEFGYTDTLESQPINISLVDLLNRDSVFLSFSYQAGGNIEPPDPIDFLRLEFKLKYGRWKSIVTLKVVNAPDLTAFYDTLIQLKDNLPAHDTVFHDDFQFRFISFGRKSGMFDAWHVDYVYFNEHRHKNDNNFPDRALSKPLGPIFGKYYAEPIKHFFNQPKIDRLNRTDFYLKNNNNTETQLNFSTFLVSKKNYADSPFVINSASLDSNTPPYPGDDGTTLSKELRQGFIKKLPSTDSLSLFDPAAKGIEFTLTLWLNSGDNKPLTDPLSDYSAIYEPIDFRVNDTLSVKYFLDSVYAYDDGSAEYSAGLINEDNELAYRFDNVHAGEDSILNGAYIYFPSFSGASTASTFQFFVLDDNGGSPGDVIYDQTVYLTQTTNNTFTEIDFFEGVLVDNAFYIGFREPTTGKVRVGLDKSNDTGDQMYYRETATGSWLLNNTVEGSLMIRPRFGPKIVLVGVPETQPTVSLYPNPSQGNFYINGSFDQLRVISITGQSIDASIEDLQDRKRVTVSAPTSGIYIVQFRSGAKIFTEKILITK